MRLVSDIDEIAEYLQNYPSMLDESFNLSEFMEGGVMVTNGNDAGLFEIIQPGVYSGHYFFQNRGSTAKKSASAILDYIFDHSDCRVVVGMIRVSNRKARLMTRLLGFTSHGITDVRGEQCELFILVRNY